MRLMLLILFLPVLCLAEPCEKSLSNVVHVDFKLRMIFEPDGVISGGRKIFLRERQILALKLLASEPGRVFTVEEIWQAANPGVSPSKDIIDAERELAFILAEGIDRAFGFDVVWFEETLRPSQSRVGVMWDPDYLKRKTNDQ